MTEQEALHEAIASTLELDDGQILVGWTLVFETVSDGRPTAGHIYGPESMTDWRALGLLEWARNVTIPGSVED